MKGLESSMAAMTLREKKKHWVGGVNFGGERCQNKKRKALRLDKENKK